jgi:hypothetical protein
MGRGAQVAGGPEGRVDLRRGWAAECLEAVPARTGADGTVEVTVAVAAVVAVAAEVVAAAADCHHPRTRGFSGRAFSLERSNFPSRSGQTRRCVPERRADQNTSERQ